jgi:hypothetical protein
MLLSCWFSTNLCFDDKQIQILPWRFWWGWCWGFLMLDLYSWLILLHVLCRAIPRTISWPWIKLFCFQWTLVILGPKPCARARHNTSEHRTSIVLTLRFIISAVDDVCMYYVLTCVTGVFRQGGSGKLSGDPCSSLVHTRSALRFLHLMLLDFAVQTKCLLECTDSA